jgi:hypothetical protein
LQKKWKILNKPDPSSFTLGCDGSCFCALKKGGREIEMVNPLSFHKNQSHQVDSKGPLNMVVLGSIHAPLALSPLQMMIVSSSDNKSMVLGRRRTIAFDSSVVVLASLLNLHNPNSCRSRVGWGLGKGDVESAKLHRAQVLNLKSRNYTNFYVFYGLNWFYTSLIGFHWFY